MRHLPRSRTAFLYEKICEQDALHEIEKGTYGLEESTNACQRSTH